MAKILKIKKAKGLKDFVAVIAMQIILKVNTPFKNMEDKIDFNEGESQADILFKDTGIQPTQEQIDKFYSNLPK